MKTEKHKRALQNALLALVSTAVGLGIGECGLRALGFEEEVARRQTVFDPRWGTVRADSWIFDFHVDPAAEEANLRGQVVPVVPDDDEIRVLFVGDSGTEGVRLPLEETYPLAFQGQLDEARPGHGVRAINAGVFGTTTIDQMHFLEQRLVALSPDVVVVGLFMANDINFNLAHAERSRTVSPTTPWSREVVQRSALAQFLYFRLLTLNAHHGWFRTDDLAEESVVPREITLIDEHGFHMLSYPAGEVATYVDPPSALMRRAFGVLENVLWQLVRLGTRHGFAVRALLIPTPSAVAGRLRMLHYPDIRERLLDTGIELDALELDFDAPTRQVLAICESMDVPCFDPTNRMREIGDEVFFPDDEHPTATGHAVLATELVAHYETLLP